MQAQFRSQTKNALELRTALSNGQFELFYQAQVRADGSVSGAEALLRWNHPKRGKISPAEFIPLAQRTGFMPTIGEWVIVEACKTLARWQENASTRHLTLSINITADHFVDTGFAAQLLEAVSSNAIDARLLKLELTESVFLSDIDAAIAKMKLLHRAGFAIALDDFGTGYSSLSYLRQLPLKQLKIDRSFVKGVSENGRLSAITKNIVRMGHDLSLEVLAEGVVVGRHPPDLLDGSRLERPHGRERVANMGRVEGASEQAHLSARHTRSHWRGSCASRQERSRPLLPRCG